MNGCRTITPTEDAADRNNRDIDEQMLAIARVSGIGEGFEITPDGTNIDELRHQRHP